MGKGRLMLGTQLDAVIFSAGVQHVVKFMEPENIDLDCDRKHFGCSYCATYFDNLDKYLHHLGK